MLFSGAKGELVFRHERTLHGFNAYTDDDSLILGLLRWPSEFDHPIPSSIPKEPDDKTTIHHIRNTLNLRVEEYKSFDFVSSSYAGDCLQIPIPLRHKSGMVIDGVRAMGYGIRLQTKLGCFYGPKDPLFSKEVSENLWLDGYEQSRKMLASSITKDPIKKPGALWESDFLNLLRPSATFLADERLWATDCGRAFAKHIFTHLTPPDQADVLKDLKIPLIFKDSALRINAPCTFDYPPATVDIKEISIAKKEKEKEKDECVVCLSNTADTMVLPCMHHVVCRACSEKLGKTPDATTCIQCRKPITQIVS